MNSSRTFWALRWKHWENPSDTWTALHWTRADAITAALFGLCPPPSELTTPRERDDWLIANRQRLWRQLRRRGLEVVKVSVFRAELVPVKTDTYVYCDACGCIHESVPDWFEDGRDGCEQSNWRAVFVEGGE